MEELRPTLGNEITPEASVGSIQEISNRTFLTDRLKMGSCKRAVFNFKKG